MASSRGSAYSSHAADDEADAPTVMDLCMLGDPRISALVGTHATWPAVGQSNVASADSGCSTANANCEYARDIDTLGRPARLYRRLTALNRAAY
jgi:hypothetical protein